MATKKWWDGWYDPEEAEQMQKTGQAMQPQQPAVDPRKASYEQALGRPISDQDWAKIQSANRPMTITGGGTPDRHIGVDFDKSPKAGVEAASRYFNDTGKVPDESGVKTGVRYSGFEDSPMATKVKSPGDLSGVPPWQQPYTAPNGKTYEMDAQAIPGPMAKLDQAGSDAVAAINTPYTPKSTIGVDPWASGYTGNVKTSGLDAPTHYKFEPDVVTAKAPPPPAQPIAPEFKPYTKGIHPEDPWAQDSAKLDELGKKAMEPYQKPSPINAGNAGKYSAELDDLEKKAMAPYQKPKKSGPSFASAVANKKKAG